MSDVVSIELVLDPECEGRVRADWDNLERAGLSSLAAHRSPSNRPHITLLARPALELTSFSRAIDLLPVRVVLGDPMVFTYTHGPGDRGILVRPIELSADLLQLHRAVHELARAGQDAAHTVPGEWTPHVTLARRLRLDRLSDALDLLAPAYSGTLVSLRRWDSASATVTELG